MSTLGKILALASAGAMLISNTLNAAAPQHDAHGTLFLLNRQWRVSSVYEPDELATSDVPGQVRKLRPDAAEALKEMFQACKEEAHVTLLSVSGYRSYQKQSNIYRRKLRAVNRDEAKAQEYVAPPGASEHHLGLAMDIGQKSREALEVSFGLTEGGKWCRENCWRFGYILRYDEPWEDITGYKFEPWHFRYVGKEFAKEIHDSGVPYETWLTGHRIEVLRALLGENDEPGIPVEENEESPETAGADSTPPPAEIPETSEIPETKPENNEESNGEKPDEEMAEPADEPTDAADDTAA